MEKGKKFDNAEANTPKNNSERDSSTHSTHKSKKEPCNDETCAKTHVHSYKTQHRDACMDGTCPRTPPPPQVVNCSDLCCSSKGSKSTIPYLPPFQDSSMSIPSRKIPEVRVVTRQPIDKKPDQNDKTERNLEIPVVTRQPIDKKPDQNDKTERNLEVPVVTRQPIDKNPDQNDKTERNLEIPVVTRQPIDKKPDQNDKPKREQFVYSTKTDQPDKIFDKDKNKTEPKSVAYVSDAANDEKKDKNKTDPKSVPYVSDATNDEKKDKNKTDPKSVPYVSDAANDEKKDKNKTDPKSVPYVSDATNDEKKDKNKTDPKSVPYVSDAANDEKKDKNKTDPKSVPYVSDASNDEKKDKNKTDPKSVPYANDNLTVKPLTDSSSQRNDKTNKNDKSSVPIDNVNNMAKNDYPLVELLEKQTQTHRQLDKNHYSYSNSDTISFTNENDANISPINKNPNTNLIIDKTFDKNKRDSDFSLSNLQSSSFIANGKINKPNKNDKANVNSMPLKEKEPLQQPNNAIPNKNDKANDISTPLKEPLQQPNNAVPNKNDKANVISMPLKEPLQQQNIFPNENDITSSRSNAVTTVGALKEIPKEEIKDKYCNAEDPCILSFNDITSAAFMIKDGIERTPCIRSRLSEELGMELFMKMEIMQYTGSFKERGARYALLKLPAQQKKQGVIAASLGNHAQGLSYHAHLLGIPATVVMPTAAPIMKIQNCRNYGANVLVQGKDMGEAKKIAMQLSQDQNLLYINGYDHPHIMAGQGTIGLEILEQVPNPDAVIIPIGGAGLMAGIATAIKQINPKCMIIGVESDKCPSYSKAVENNGPIYTVCRNTLADGLAVPTVGYNAFVTTKSLIDKVVVVKEEWIALGILRLVEAEKCVVEGAGAACLAAILAGHLNELKGKRVVILISGGNIDTTIFGRCLERGLVADGRLIKFTVRVTDAPGGLKGLCDLLASNGVSVKDIMHERAWLKDVFSVEIKCICETRDWNHSVQVKNILKNTYEYVEFVNEPLAVSHF